MTPPLDTVSPGPIGRVPRAGATVPSGAVQPRTPTANKGVLVLGVSGGAVIMTVLLAAVGVEVTVTLVLGHEDRTRSPLGDEGAVRCTEPERPTTAR